MSRLKLYVRRNDNYPFECYTLFEDDEYGEICVEHALQAFLDRTVLTPEMLRQAADILERHLKEVVECETNHW